MKSPVAEGGSPRSRVKWENLPDSIRLLIESICGSKVIAAESQTGGYSPGSADRITTADGKKYFAKAVSASLNVISPQLHRKEADIMTLLPEGLPIPELLGSYDDGEWVVLVFIDVDGHHPKVSEDDINTVLDALDSIASRPLSSELIEALPSLAGKLRNELQGWEKLRADPEAKMIPWAADNIGLLESLSATAADALEGDRLVHFDIRADNILIDQSGEAIIVDWPGASCGASWFDALTLLIDARLNDSSFDVDSVIRQHSIFSSVDPQHINSVLAALAGSFLDRAREPSPPSLPTLSAFRQLEGEACLSLLRERLS